MILVDTNILLRMAQPSHSMHSAVVSAVSLLTERGETPCVVPQVLYEYWAAGTRPAQVNGLALSAAEVDTDIAKILQRFRLLPDDPAIFDIWLRLAALHQVLGKNAYDARLVAAMDFHGIAAILTFNVGDFARFAGVTVIDSASIAAA